MVAELLGRRVVVGGKAKGVGGQTGIIILRDGGKKVGVRVDGTKDEGGVVDFELDGLVKALVQIASRSL